MAISIDATNPNNWQPIWLFQLPNRPRRKVKDRLICPILLTSPVLAIYFSHEDAFNREWNIAGYVNQQIQTGLTIGGSPVGLTSGGTKIFLNQLQIIIFPVESEYALRIDIEAWINGASDIRVWEYKGIIESPSPAMTEEQTVALQDLTASLKGLLNAP
jgi:hypothetical protein